MELDGFLLPEFFVSGICFAEKLCDEIIMPFANGAQWSIIAKLKHVWLVIKLMQILFRGIMI